MKNIFVILICLAVAALGRQAWAGPSTDAGYFYCQECVMTAPTMDPDTRIFIATTVNRFLPGSWLNSNQEPMHVEICNDAICVTWQYTGGGQFISTNASRNNGSHTYRNGVGGGSGGGDGSVPRSGGNGGGSGCFTCGSGGARGGIVIVGPIQPGTGGGN